MYTISTNWQTLKNINLASNKLGFLGWYELRVQKKRYPFKSENDSDANLRKQSIIQHIILNNNKITIYFFMTAFFEKGTHKVIYLFFL